MVGAIHELPLLLRSPASAYLRVTRLRVTVTPTFISLLVYPGCVIGNMADFAGEERLSLKVIPCYDGRGNS